MTWRLLADDLAAALRRQGQCMCMSVKSWPWRRDVKCEMHKALEAYDLAVAQIQIIQAPARKCEACGQVVKCS